MARARMVTRTVITTQVTVLAMDVQQGEAFNDTLELAGQYKDDEKLLKAVKKVFDNDDRVAVKVVDKQEKETLYGMSEQKFIEQAEELPDEQVKRNKQKEGKN